MFQIGGKKTYARSTYQMLELCFHWTVRTMTQGGKTPLGGIINSIIQVLVMTAVFFGMFQLLGGARAAPVRGDFMVFMMTGIMMFLTHTQAAGAVAGAGDPNSPMMLHAPMNMMVAIVSKSVAMIYRQIVAMGVILFIYDAITDKVEFHHFLPAFGMFLLAWISGCCVGVLLLGLKPFLPKIVPIITLMYRRANMLFSGKMFLANSMPASMLPMFEWNPLFHIIDQSRGFAFINYNPHFTSIFYPVIVSMVCLVLGLMLEFSGRKE